MKVSCAESGCGKLFEAKRRGATFCSVKCRQAASRRDREARSEGQIAAISPISPPESPENRPDSPLVAALRRELDEAGVADTADGMVAIRLAEKLSQPGDTGSAMASLARQLSAAKAEALASGTKKADSLDELAARRLNKAAG